MAAKLFALVCFGILLYAIAIALGFVGGIGNLAVEGLEPVLGHMDFGTLGDILDVASDFVRGLLP